MAYKRLRVISSVLVYILLGLPVWWQLTSIHRPAIPFERVQQAAEDVSTRSTLLPVELIVYQAVGEQGTDWEQESRQFLPLTDVKHVVENAAGACTAPPCLNLTGGVLRDVANAEQLDEVLHKLLQQAGLSRPGLYMLFVLPSPAALSQNAAAHNLVVGQYRHAWLYHTRTAAGGETIQQLMKAAAPAVKKMLGFQRGGSRSGAPELPISAASQTILSFSLCNADPTAGFYTWRFGELREKYLQPLILMLAPVVQLSVHSQVLYHTPTPAAIKWSREHKAFIVSEKELPFFVDSNWNLDSGRSVIGTASGAADVAAATTPPFVLHWVIFIPPPSQRPLRIRLRDGSLSPSNSFWIPSWGGVLIINPEDVGKVDATRLSGDSERDAPQPILHQDLPATAMQQIAGVLVSHLHSLMGLSPILPPATTPASYLPEGAPPLARTPLFLPPLSCGFTSWEVEHLIRLTVQARLEAAAKTLQSLARLVQELPNLEMPDLIGDQVWLTLEAINNTLQAVQAGSYLEASASATQACGSAEVAFSHPAVLAQLNFPESHKLGIYMPYFLPVAVPLLQAIAGELRRLIRKKRSAAVCWGTGKVGARTLLR